MNSIAFSIIGLTMSFIGLILNAIASVYTVTSKYHKWSIVLPLILIGNLFCILGFAICLLSPTLN